MDRLLVQAEVHKLVLQRTTQIAAAVLVFVVLAFSYLAVTSVRYVDVDGVAHTNILSGRQLIGAQQEWAGHLTPELIAQAVEQERKVRALAGGPVSDTLYGRFLQQNEPIITIASGMVLGRDEDYDPEAILGADSATISQIYNHYRANLAETARSEGQTPQRIAYLQAAYDRLDLPLAYGSMVVWETMIYYAMTVCLLLVPAIGLFVVRLFSDDLDRHTASVYFTTLHGSSRAIRAKIVAALLTATTVYGVGIGLLSAIGFGVLGFTGADLPIQLSYRLSIYSLTFGQLYGVLVAFGLIAALLTAALTMLVSVFTRGKALAVALPFALFLLTPFLARALPLNTVFSLSPFELLNVINNVKIPVIYQVGDWVWSQYALLPVIHLVGAGILLTIGARRFRAYSVR